ncbi:MAG: transporter [Bacteroidales bacterium]|nr:transporter [Bacteroidales bacterium]
MDAQVLSYFSLFLIIFLGYFLGKIKVFGISLDVAAVLFVAMFLGHFGFVVPQELKMLGLALFIFSIGFQAGPSLIESFKKEGLNLLILGGVIVVSGVLITILLAYLFDVNGIVAAGLFSGALTSSPGLAALTEISHNAQGSIAYGIAYPFGVIGVVLFVKLYPRIFKINLNKEECEYREKQQKEYGILISRHFVVENENIVGKSIADMHFRKITGANISRVFQNGVTFTPLEETPLYKGSIIKVVGNEDSLGKVENLIGKSTTAGIGFSENYEMRYITITNKTLLGKSISELEVHSRFNTVITRIRRGGVELYPGNDVRIQFGDRLRVGGSKENLRELASYLGDNQNIQYDSDFWPVSLGIILGVLIGLPVLHIGGLDFSLGTTGGVLIVSIIMSRLGRIGPVVFSVSSQGNFMFRQFGLLLFLTALGSEAGAGLIETLSNNGWHLVLIGMIITIVPMILAVIVGKFLMKQNVLTMLGAITGGMTSTPGLGAVASMTKTNAPSVAYATIYPIALVLMIIGVQIILFVL